jgi:ankyrin repeat protein
VQNERTPLMLAAQLGHIECAQLLLDAGAVIEAKHEAR